MSDDFPFGMLLFVVVLVIAIFGAAGAIMGRQKGASGTGAVLGAALGPVGLVITAYTKGDRKNCRFCQGLVSLDALVCPHCRNRLAVPFMHATPYPDLPDDCPVPITVPTSKIVPQIVMEAHRYFIARAGGEVLGPYTQQEIANLRGLNIVDEATLFCREGEQGWLKNME
jgi:hypothetical protein